MNSTRNVLYNIAEWITRLAYLNVLWVFFTIVGLGIFGFFPATAAMFAICRDWLNRKTGIPVFTSFWNYYRKEFLKSNLLGLMISFIMIIIVVDFYFIFVTSDMLIRWTYIPLLTLIILAMLFYVFPTFVHFDLNIAKMIKTTFLVIFAKPLSTLIILICLASMLVLMKLFPALAFIFGGSSIAYMIMWQSLIVFAKVTSKTAK